ncbi:MAG: hypothetical protein IKJ04_08655 [Clostridia bacterium]|nr:hypothetical protein [Clostridia bacterium]MBR2908320.1 hypothetical protein [Clostridia bacterium]MBR4034866.1 hypothetical protein [Clostridia bacterium]
MKKVFILVLILLLLSLTACNVSTVDPLETTDVFSETTSDPLETTDSSVTSANRGYTGGVGSTDTVIEWSLFYRSLEGILPDVTDIVLATFEGYTAQGLTYKYKFSISESIRGLGTEREITVSSTPAYYNVLDKNTSFSTYECRYQTNAKYLLLLKRTRTTYNEEESFSFAEDSLIIRATSPKRILLDSSSLYGGPLRNHVETDALRSALQGATFMEEFLSLVKENPFYYGEGYEGTSDMESVLLHSDFVFEVTVDSVFMETFDKTAITYQCTINRTHKGEPERTDILVKFSHNNDIVGEAFIVGLNLHEAGNSFYLMSSPYSVFDISERDAIIALINAEK